MKQEEEEKCYIITLKLHVIKLQQYFITCKYIYEKKNVVKYTPKNMNDGVKMIYKQVEKKI